MKTFEMPVMEVSSCVIEDVITTSLAENDTMIG